MTCGTTWCVVLIQHLISLLSSLVLRLSDSHTASDEKLGGVRGRGYLSSTSHKPPHPSVLMTTDSMRSVSHVQVALSLILKWKTSQPK